MKSIKQHILERLVISKNKHDYKKYTFNDLTSLLKKYDEQYHKPFNLKESETFKEIKEKYNFVASYRNTSYSSVYHEFINMYYSENWAHHPEIKLDYVNHKYDNRIETTNIINENNFMYIFGGGTSDLFMGKTDPNEEMAQDYLNLLCKELYYEIH